MVGPLPNHVSQCDGSWDANVGIQAASSGVQDFSDDLEACEACESTRFVVAGWFEVDDLARCILYKV